MVLPLDVHTLQFNMVLPLDTTETENPNVTYMRYLKKNWISVIAYMSSLALAVTFIVLIFQHYLSKSTKHATGVFFILSAVTILSVLGVHVKKNF